MQDDNYIRINVAMCTLPITQIFAEIVTVMEAVISNASLDAYREFEREAAIMRWYEALEHYLTFTLSHTQGNIGVDYYINDYFMAHARFLQTPDFLQLAGARFAQAAGMVSQALHLACQRIEEQGAVLEEIEYTPNGLQQGHFLLTAIHQGSKPTPSLPNLQGKVPGSMATVVAPMSSFAY